MTPPLHRFTRVEFRRFKAFRAFRLDLRAFNILVGPNNAGKSTIIAAFRILAAGMRRAAKRKAELLRSQKGTIYAHYVELSAISVAEENIFYNYNDDEPAEIIFYLSNKHILCLYFPERGTCYLIPDALGKPVISPTAFQSNFNSTIGFVPILGPVEQHEPLYEKEAARLALFNYRAARNFRNIWYHYPENFSDFRAALQQSWPGQDIQLPEIDYTHEKPRLNMYCPEERLPREIFWSGFGFQVWCQMLTHLIQSKLKSVFLVDEPDIYLHSELQRQLLDLLRDLGPDILIATHSTEIISEAETGDIVLVNKAHQRARRIRDPGEVAGVFGILGSSMNPVLTQLAKTRRALFVEGKDFQILGKYARKLGAAAISSRRDFAVVPVEGFSPERIRSLKREIEMTLGVKIVAGAKLDRDYRSDEECKYIIGECKKFCDEVVILQRKEIENLILVLPAIERAILHLMNERERRSGKRRKDGLVVQSPIEKFCSEKKNHVLAQHIDFCKRYRRQIGPKDHDAVITQEVLSSFETRWATSEGQLALMPGKEALSSLNVVTRVQCEVSITATAIIEATRIDEVPSEVVELMTLLDAFAKRPPTG